LYVAQQAIQETEGLGRNTRLILQKAAKAIGLANARAAGQGETITKLQRQLEACKPQQKRKRVVVDPNQRFADIESIYRAVQLVATPTVRKRRKLTRNTTKPTNTVVIDTDFKSMCTEFQI